MAGNKKSSPYIEFALTHATGTTYLSAAVAIYRCENLLNDLVELELAAKAVGRIELPYYSFEVVSYYAVGFVTCLEWHARSRIVDSVTYKPDIIEAAHFSKLNPDFLAEMMRSNVTVAHVLGALRKVNSFDAYNSVFAKTVFPALGISDEPRRLAGRLSDGERAAARLEPGQNLNEVIDQMYELRHQLVHEIGQGMIGPDPVRDSIGIELARNFGKATLMLMRIVEKTITASAPLDFPNLLDKSWIPVSQIEVLQDQVAALEKEIDARIKANEDEHVYCTWQESRQADSRSTIMRHALMENVTFGRYRYFNPRDELEILNLKLRIAYLQELLEISPEIPSDDKKMG